MKKQIGYIGLGKMGSAMALRLKQKNWDVVAYDANSKAVKQMQKRGLHTADSLKELVESISIPRIIWIMVPAGKPVDAVVNSLARYVEKGDIVIDGGNSFYEYSVRRAKKLAKKGVYFLDVGVSGGPHTVRDGKPALMIGGEKAVYQKTKPLFQALTRTASFSYMGKSGAGHFVKMIHNGIEYGMMQAIAEGFAIMKASDYTLNLTDISEVYNHGSVVESRLIGWLSSALRSEGEELESISGEVSHTGEGEWTVKEAKRLNVPAVIIEKSFQFRVESEGNPSYTGQIVSALRNQFGGHSVTKDKH